LCFLLYLVQPPLTPPCLRCRVFTYCINRHHVSYYPVNGISQTSDEDIIEEALSKSYRAKNKLR
jgi:hypothetical protein